MSRHVLMVIDSLRVGGAERITLSLANEFVKQGVTVDIIGIYDYVEYEIPSDVGYHTLHYKKRAFQNYIYSKKLQKKIEVLETQQGKPYDLILVHLLKSARLLQNYQHKNLYYILHSTMSKESLSGLTGAKYQRKLKRLKKKFEGKNLIAVSKGIAYDLQEVVKIRPKSLEVIYNPLDIEMIQTLAEEKNDFKMKEPYIVHLGRLEYVKRHDLLLEAFKQTKLASKLVLIGEGTMRVKIEKDIVALGLEDRVVLVGMKTNPYPILKNAKLLVLTSEYEGLSMAILEALALETAVVSVDAPFGPREILEGYLDDALVVQNDTQRLSEVIKKQYENPLPIPSHILDRFDAKIVVLKYLDLIDKVR